MRLPSFTREGLLPPGDYELTLKELRRSPLVLGAGRPGWDGAWRMQLVDNLAILAGQLGRVGIREIFIGGSFVEAVNHPNDIDGYFVCHPREIENGELAQNLNRLDPDQVWTWETSRREWSAISSKLELPMWHRYRVELYPDLGQPSGIRDPSGKEFNFPDAFRWSRLLRRPRGIIKIGG